MNDTQSPSDIPWERKTIEKLLLANIAEQRAKRRWTVFFRLAFLALVALFLWWIYTDTLPGMPTKASIGLDGKHTAVVTLRGTIESDNPLASAEGITAALRAAFADSNTAGVILNINSPGGSPVQSAQVFDEMRRLRAKYPAIPLHVVVDEICASGGYYIAAAADSIHVSSASMVGSIGVLMDGFGLNALMQKLGIERRLLTAGENKGFLDPFSPLDPKQLEHVNGMLKQIHQQFITAVKTGRGQRLKNNPEMFSGLIYTGENSIQLGLSDAIGTVESVARDVIKAETLVDFSPQDNVAERLARRFGAAAGASFASVMHAAKLGINAELRPALR
jgi:protease IV